MGDNVTRMIILKKQYIMHSIQRKRGKWGNVTRILKLDKKLI